MEVTEDTTEATMVELLLTEAADGEEDRGRHSAASVALLAHPRAARGRPLDLVEHDGDERIPALIILPDFIIVVIFRSKRSMQESTALEASIVHQMDSLANSMIGVYFCCHLSGSS